MSQTDITIIGGGVIGLTLACLLSETDYQVTLIDHGHSTPSGLKKPYDLRVAAINHRSEHIFRDTGVWEIIESLRMSPYTKMHVWDENSTGKIDFDCADVGKKYLGNIIEYSVIKQALEQKLSEAHNIHLCYETKPIALQEIQDGIVITLEGGELHKTKLLVGADGGNSWVAKQSGLNIESKPYHQSALVTTIKTEKTHQHTAWQRFLSTGPLAFLPLSQPHFTSIVWSTEPDHANHLATLSEDVFNETLARSFDYQLGNVQVQDERIVFPLIQRHAPQYVKSRIALVGDAAHTIHPLAGLGMNLGLLDAATLAEFLKDQKDPGGLTHLRKYERHRKGENEIMIKAMSVFKEMFSSTAKHHVFARSTGLTLVDKTPFIKNFFIERAMGIGG